MSYTNFPVRAKAKDMVLVAGYIEGVNNDNPVNTQCEGVVVTRTGEGVYKFAFNEVNGTFVSCAFALGAATPADVDDYSVVWDEFDATNNEISVTVYSVTPAAADLIDNQYLAFQFWFAAV